MLSRAPTRSGPRHRQPTTRHHRQQQPDQQPAGRPLVARGSGDETDGATWFLLLLCPAGHEASRWRSIDARERGLGAPRLPRQSRPPTHNPVTARPDHAGSVPRRTRTTGGRSARQAIPLAHFQRPERDAVGSGVFRQHAHRTVAGIAPGPAQLARRIAPFLAGPRAGTRPSSTGAVAGAGCSSLTTGTSRKFTQNRDSRSWARTRRYSATAPPCVRSAQAQERRRQHERHPQPRQIVGVRASPRSSQDCTRIGSPPILPT